MEPTEELNELDRAFDLLLVLLGIITSALFQFQSTRLPLEIAALNPNLTQKEIFAEVNKQMATSLRVFFIPLILLIGVWFVNRIALRARIRARKSASEFCYLMCFTILGHNVIYFMGAVTFRSLQFMVTIGPSPPTVIIVIFTILISLGLVYSHEIPFISRENIRTRKETFARIWKPVLVRTLVIWFVTLAINNSIVLLSLTSY